MKLSPDFPEIAAVLALANLVMANGREGALWREHATGSLAITTCKRLQIIANFVVSFQNFFAKPPFQYIILLKILKGRVKREICQKIIIIKAPIEEYQCLIPDTNNFWREMSRFPKHSLGMPNAHQRLKEFQNHTLQTIVPFPTVGSTARLESLSNETPTKLSGEENFTLLE